MPQNKVSSRRFILKGFSQEQGFRRFAFECIDEDQVRSPFTIQADLALIRLYGIHLQDLPLLCREVLERSEPAEGARGLVFTEADMRQHRANRLALAEAAEQKKKFRRRVPPENAGAGWRTTAPLITHNRI